MTYQEILTKDNANILITGDSISYNCYPYVKQPKAAAMECGVGMGSWSFQLRDLIYKSDPQFMYGEQLRFNCNTVQGIANDSDVENVAIFDGKIQTIMPEEEVTFTIPIKGHQIVLYLQRRIDAPCLFDVYVDGELVEKDVNTQGDIEEHAGYGLMIVCLPCSADKSKHVISFKNIRGANKKITVAGVGAKHINITNTGRGNQCTRFFVENFEERIGKYHPDLIILSLTANDRARIAPEVLRRDLLELFSMIFGQFPKCKVLFMLPPSAHDPKHPDRDVTPYTALQTEEVYRGIVEAVCLHLGEEGYDDFGLKNDMSYDIEMFHIADLFDNDKVSLWRYDNIHLSAYGNEILLKAVAERMRIELLKEEDYETI